MQKRSPYVSSQIWGDDGVFPLGCLGRHTQVEWVNIGLTDCDLWVPVGIAGTNSKVSFISCICIGIAWTECLVVPIDTSAQNVENFLNIWIANRLTIGIWSIISVYQV